MMISTNATMVYYKFARIINGLMMNHVCIHALKMIKEYGAVYAIMEIRDVRRKTKEQEAFRKHAKMANGKTIKVMINVLLIIAYVMAMLRVQLPKKAGMMELK